MADVAEPFSGVQRTLAEPDRASRLLEADDVANHLGMRIDWVFREDRAGRLPHIRLGRAVRFRRESIEAWLEARERAVPPPRRA
jgi:excisionase family DNA binding protein